MNFLEEPESPADVRVEIVSSRSVQVEWKAVYDGNSPILNYIIHYKNITGIKIQ